MLDTTVDFRHRRSMGTKHALKLGLFGQNCSSGRAATRVPERWSGTWPDNLKLAQMADDAGIDFLLPIARWKGYRGETNFHGAVLETITWACGLLAHTKRINVFGTVHAPLVHPVFAAKQFTTVDLISEGRFGLNMVAGWNKDEFDMFGTEQHEHDMRYDYAQEWVEVIKQLWESSGTSDYNGRFFQLPNLAAEPKPFGGSRPIIMNAGASPRGREFAIATSDMLFTLLVTLEQGAKTAADVKAQAAAAGRDIDVYTSSYCVVRPTRAEAEEYHRYYVDEQGDWEALDHLAELAFPNPEHRASKNFGEMKKRFIGGNGSYPLVGSPDDVAAELARIHDAGYTGMVTSFVNYLDEFPYFRQEVMPRLERLGLREPL
jgi:FMNH2-dependent dimethyl sulfone monooxygenase